MVFPKVVGNNRKKSTRELPLKGESPQLVRGDGHLSLKWRECSGFLYLGAPNQASIAQVMMVLSLYLYYKHLYVNLVVMYKEPKKINVIYQE